MRTRRPRFSSNSPIAAEVSPLPSELTTPPVTKMCLVMKERFGISDFGFWISVLRIQCSAFEWLGSVMLIPESRILNPLFHKSSIVFRGVNSNRRALDEADPDRGAGLEGTQLLQLFQPFEPTDRQVCEFHQEFAAVGI